MTQPIWLTEADITKLVSINQAIAALRYQLPREFGDGARNMEKSLATWEPRSSMHNLGSIDPIQGVGGIKSWVNTPKGARAIYVLFDTNAGHILAAMDAATLGALRTAAISGLATEMMTDTDTDSLSIIGTGRQALAQVAAISVVRPLRRIYVFSPTEANKTAFCKMLEQNFEANIISSENLEHSVRASPILTVITRAKDPFISGKMIEKGTHINALGAILPANSELQKDVLERVDHIVVDNRENAQKSSSELNLFYGNDPKPWKDLPVLGQLLKNNSFVFKPGQITCFKAMGMGLSDLAIAITAYKEALSQNIGQLLGTAETIPMRWKSLSFLRK